MIISMHMMLSVMCMEIITEKNDKYTITVLDAHLKLAEVLFGNLWERKAHIESRYSSTCCLNLLFEPSVCTEQPIR